MENKKDIFNKLVDMKKTSYAPYSNFRVTSIVITEDGKEYKGVNIENAAYPVTVCGERVAMFSAYANDENKKTIKELHLLTDSKGYGTPCGVCRQVMFELLKKDTPIYIWKDTGDCVVKTVDELLPFGFGSESL